MPLTRTEARDEILGRLKAVLDASTYAGIAIAWDDTETDIPGEPQSDEEGPESWLRVKLQHNLGGQGSLADDGGEKMWDRIGFVLVEVRTPSVDGLTLNDDLSSIIQGAYEGYSTPGGAWFRNARSVEVGVDGAWYWTNVFADFEYVEVK